MRVQTSADGEEAGRAGRTEGWDCMDAGSCAAEMAEEGPASAWIMLSSAAGKGAEEKRKGVYL